MVGKISRTTSGARPRLGSSSIRRVGRDISARPTASICRSPPDSVPASCVRRSFRRGNSSIHHVHLVAPLGVAQPHLAKGAQHQVVFHRHAAEQLALFGHQRDAQHHALFQRQRGDGLALELDGAAAGQYAHQRIEQGGLAGAVGADDGDDAALGGLQVDAVQHLGPAVAGAQVVDAKVRFVMACFLQCSVPR